MCHSSTGSQAGFVALKHIPFWVLIHSASRHALPPLSTPRTVLITIQMPPLVLMHHYLCSGHALPCAFVERPPTLENVRHPESGIRIIRQDQDGF
jgi:hypothetical protein